MNEFLVVGILFGLVFFRAVLVGVLTFLIIHPVRVCPACLEGRTLPVRKRWLVLVARRLEWRWCVGCGWEGLARKVVPAGSRTPAAGSHGPLPSGSPPTRPGTAPPPPATPPPRSEAPPPRSEAPPPPPGSGRPPPRQRGPVPPPSPEPPPRGRRRPPTSE